MIWLLPLLLAPGIGGLAPASLADDLPSGDSDEFRSELGAREADLLRTDMRLARASQDRVDVQAEEVRAARALEVARSALTSRAASLYRMGHATRIALAIGEGARETMRAMTVLAREARRAAERCRRAEETLARATAQRARLQSEIGSARVLRAALAERIRDLRQTLGLADPRPIEAVATVSEPEPAARPEPPAQGGPAVPSGRPATGDFVHPVWSTLPLLWAKRGSEAPILRYPTFDGAIIRSAFRGRIASIERVRNKGKVVRIDHGGGVATVLTDLLRVTVRVGDEVARGGILGRARGPVLFEMLDGERNIDPRPWLDIPVAR